MNHRRQLAAALALALAVSLCGGAVLATETTQPESGDTLLSAPAPDDAETIPAAPDTVDIETDTPETDKAEANQPAANSDTAASVQPEPEEEAVVNPDAEGTVSFANLENRMRAGYFSLLSLEETLNSLRVIDYDKMTDDLRDAINAIADAQWFMHLTGNSVAAQSLQANYDSLKATFDDLYSGKFQEDQATLMRQLENAQDQIIMAGESLYIALVELDQTDATLARNLATLDRTLAELEIRYEMGQISALNLSEAKAGRASLVSGRETLSMNRINLRYQLQSMLGTELTGTLQLTGLPALHQSELDNMDVDTDLAKAKQASYELLAAQATLDDAKEAYDDACEEYNSSPYKYEFVSAQHTWSAAQYTYDAAVQNYELNFRALYAQVKDYEQVLAAAKTSLAIKQDNFAAAQIKYEQGAISEYKLLDAKDAVAEAQDTVDSTAIDLFTAYNNYRWAVERGILN